VIIDYALAGAPLVLDEPEPEVLVQEFAASTIDVACRFWHQPEIEASWAARDEAMRAVKRALDAAGITIAFPQRVIWARSESPAQPSSWSANS
jgi:small-conductance mechanosensitive channel